MTAPLRLESEDGIATITLMRPEATNALGLEMPDALVEALDAVGRWIEERLAQATPEARLRGEVALFWCPTARNRAKRWTPDAFEREWARACDAAGVRRIPFQQGTRHSTLTALAQVLPERVLRDFSRHRDGKSLDHYAKAKATPEAIVKALRPQR